MFCSSHQRDDTTKSYHAIAGANITSRNTFTLSLSLAFKFNQLRTDLGEVMVDVYHQEIRVQYHGVGYLLRHVTVYPLHDVTHAKNRVVAKGQVSLLAEGFPALWLKNMALYCVSTNPNCLMISMG